MMAGTSSCVDAGNNGLVPVSSDSNSLSSQNCFSYHLVLAFLLMKRSQPGQGSIKADLALDVG